MKRTKKRPRLSEQVKQKVFSPKTKKPEYDGDIGIVVSTDSTLLDLAISGGRIRGGGIPGGILVEIFGPNGTGKTILLSELAGDVQRKKGQVMFYDPEARLNKPFARLFGLDTNKMDYSNPDTVPEIFSAVREWKPKPRNLIHGVFADSLAALSTSMEMEDEDKMGLRRAKEFSEQLRKTCRVLAQQNYLMVCSNQVRQSMEQFGAKYKSPGGEAIGFYSSLRLRTMFTTNPKIRRKARVAGKEIKRVVGVNIEVEVFKSSVWSPYHTAPVTILFDYGIDDIRQNLQFIKDHTHNTTYMLGEKKLDTSMEKSIQIIEEGKLEDELREEVIDLWERVESKFKSDRKTKIR